MKYTKLELSNALKTIFDNLDLLLVALEVAKQTPKIKEQNKRYREAIDYVMKTEAGHYSNMYELLEDVKFVINKTLESESE